MANSVTFPTEYGGSGITITDDADPTTGLDGTGYTERFVPALKGALDMAGHAVQKAGEASSSAQTATQAAQQASDDRDSINLDLQTLNGLVTDADASANAAAGSATTATNMADAVAEATETYTSTAAGLAATVDTNYFRVIEAPDASRVSVYRNDSGSATPITTYYTQAGVDAKAAAGVRLNRSLQRLGDYGQTLHSDFNLNAYGLGSAFYGGVQDALEAEELWTTERPTPTLAYQHTADDTLKYVEVPPNVLAREYNSEAGKYQAQIHNMSSTGRTLYSNHFMHPLWRASGVDVVASSLNSPFGVRVPADLIEDTSLGVHQIEQGIGFLESGDIVTGLFIAKMPEGPLRSALFRVGRGPSESVAINTDGTVEVGSRVKKHRVRHIGSGLIEVYLTVEIEVTSTNQYQNVQLLDGTNANYTGDGVSFVTLVHANHWMGSAWPPPVVTEDAPVTRAQDVPVRLLGSEFNHNQGTVFLDCVPQILGSAGFMLSLSGGNQDNYVGLGYIFSNSISGSMYWRKNGSGFASSNLTPTPSESTQIKALLSWEGKKILYVVNGQVLFNEISEIDMPDIIEARLNSLSSPNEFAAVSEGNNYWISPYSTDLATAQELTAL